MTEPTRALAYARKNREHYLNEYKEFLRIPSVSTLSEHKPDMQRAAEWLAAMLRGMGFANVEILPTAKHPVVYGEWLKASGKPTVLVYGHYDVQPVDPLNEWTAGPFEPTVRDDDYMYVLNETPPEAARARVVEAVQRCPKQAIKLVDE